MLGIRDGGGERRALEQEDEDELLEENMSGVEEVWVIAGPAVWDFCRSSSFHWLHWQRQDGCACSWFLPVALIRLLGHSG